MITAKNLPLALLSTASLALASCGNATVGDSSADAASTPSPTMGATGGAASAGTDEGTKGPFQVTSFGEFDQPWALDIEPGSGVVFITEKPGTMKFVDPATGRMGSVESGVPTVDYGGQGGLGDFVFGPNYAEDKMVYLSWAEAGDGGTRGAVVGRGTLNCAQADSCSIDGLQIIWRQAPKVSGRGHYSHRIAFSPDGQYLFVSSGDRQKMEPAQDTSNTLGSVVRLTLDGTPAAGNPMADKGAPANEIWSYGHRNVLGLQFDGAGRLWDLEHGPKGGDELNLVEAGANYGWPVVSDGVHYDNDPIPNNVTRPDLKAPAIGWTPVIAPGDFIFYDGSAFGAWQGDALIAGLSTKAIIHVDMNGTTATETARYDFDKRLREIDQGTDGAIWVLEDGDGGRLLRLMPA